MRTNIATLAERAKQTRVLAAKIGMPKAYTQGIRAFNPTVQRGVQLLAGFPADASRSSYQKPVLFVWTPVRESLPDDDATVLIALSDGEVWTGFRDAGEWRFVSAEPVDQGSGVTVTHWAPIPEAPKA